MGTGGKPGLTFKMQVTSNNGNSASLSGDGVSLGIGADKETIAYFTMGSILSLTSILLALLTAVSLTAAIKQHPPANIERWLWAQLVYMPFVWVAGLAWDDESWQYATVYCTFTAPILYAVLRIAWDTLRPRRYRMRAFAISAILAAVLTEAARMDMHGRWAWISMAEGFLLLLSGILTSMAGAYRPRWDLYWPLGMFWILQGGYSLGWTIHGEFWKDWNWIVPPAMGLVCFSYLVWRLAPQEHIVSP